MTTLALLLSLSAFTPAAHAEGSMMLNSIYKGTRQVSMLPGQDDLSNTVYFYADEDKPIEDAKSSNEKVATVDVKKRKSIAQSNGSEAGDYYMLKVCFKGPGTTRVSYAYKGRRHTVTFKVYRYANPFKVFSIDSQNYRYAFASRNLLMNGYDGYQALLKTKTISGALNIEPAKGWQIKRIYYHGLTNTYIKNGAKVDRPFCVDMENTSTHLVETFWVAPDYQVKLPVANDSSYGYLR